MLWCCGAVLCCSLCTVMLWCSAPLQSSVVMLWCSVPLQSPPCGVMVQCSVAVFILWCYGAVLRCSPLLWCCGAVSRCSLLNMVLWCSAPLQSLGCAVVAQCFVGGVGPVLVELCGCRPFCLVAAGHAAFCHPHSIGRLLALAKQFDTLRKSQQTVRGRQHCLEQIGTVNFQGAVLANDTTYVPSGTG